MTHTLKCNHILVVEDDKAIRDSIQEILLDSGYKVKTAVNGQDAIDQLLSAPANQRPCFILLDLMMPIMNGWEFLLAQRSNPELAKIPVMIASAVAERDKFPGIRDFIKKPYDLDTLLNAVRKHCDLTGSPEHHS